MDLKLNLRFFKELLKRLVAAAMEAFVRKDLKWWSETG